LVRIVLAVAIVFGRSRCPRRHPMRSRSASSRSAPVTPTATAAAGISAASRRGVGAGQRAANIAEIRRRLAVRGIRLIVLERIRSLTPRASRDPDGQHFDARGHAAVAAYLVPQVIAALGKR
jgi:hypothetical protein